MAAIEALDPESLCTDYWAGKHERERAAAGMPMPIRAGAGRRAGVPSPQRRRQARQVSPNDGRAHMDAAKEDMPKPANMSMFDV